MDADQPVEDFVYDFTEFFHLYAVMGGHLDLCRDLLSWKDTYDVDDILTFMTSSGVMSFCMKPISTIAGQTAVDTTSGDGLR